MLLHILFSTIGNAQVWTIEKADAPKFFTQVYPRSIAIDKDNRLHAAYGGDHLYYAYFDGVKWQHETLDNYPGVGEFASIAIDSNNKVHISYYDSTFRILKYATNATGTWATYVIDNKQFVGYGTSIALDSNNSVHIGYYGDKDLRYATNASGSWVISIVDNAGDVGSYPSIAVDSNNKVHISYLDSNDLNNLHLKYATDETGQWVISTIDNKVMGYSAIAVDSNKKVHISYQGGDKKNLKYATNASGSWDITTVDPTEDVGSNTSIAIDSNNKAQISYIGYTYGDNALLYATNASGSWEISKFGGSFSHTSIVLDSQNNVYISYYVNTTINNETTRDFKYITNVSGSWISYTIDREGWAGMDSSIALDSKDKVHISYHEWFYNNLKYVTNVSGEWSTSTVDSEGNVGSESSIALDSVGNVHISYYYYDSSNNKALKYATNASGSWATYFIDSQNIVDTSIAIDSKGNVHISYTVYIGINPYLLYATNSSGAWVITQIDSLSSGWGFNTDIAIDSNDKVHISYSDGSLKYTTNSSGSWVTNTVDSTGAVGINNSIILNSNNKAHISYYDETNSTLKYATNASGEWVASTIDNYGTVGTYTSIAVDSKDKVHISYKDDTKRTYSMYWWPTSAPGRALKYATNVSGSWETSFVDTIGDVGLDTSIAIDSKDNVHISYRDNTLGDLKYATDSKPVPVPPTYSIIGKVTENGTGLANVAIALSGSSSLNTTTASDGVYSFSSISDGGYTITPSLNGYTFTPANRSVTVAGADAAGQDFSAKRDNPVNQPPILNPIGNKTVAEGNNLQFTVTATDLDGNTITLSATGVPSWASFNNATGLFSGTPGFTDSGNYSVKFTASDGSLFSEETITITVTNTNRKPVLDTIGSKSINEGANLNFTVTGNDPDGDTLTYSATGLPQGSSFDATTRIFSWTPTNTQSGSYNVTFMISDSDLSASETVSIVVNYVVVGQSHSILGKVTENSLGLGSVTITLSGASSATTTTASDGSYSFSSLSDGGYTITPSLNGYTFTPANRSVTIAGADAAGQDFSAKRNNKAPTLDSIGAKSVNEGSTLSFTINGRDPDGSSVTFSALALPQGAAFDSATRAFSWTPNYTQAGLYSVTFGVSDGELSSSETVPITVKDVSPIYSILGKVTENGTGLGGVTITLSGSSSVIANTASDGNYSFSGLSNGSYTITPSLTDYTFTPSNYSLIVSGADVNAQDFSASFNKKASNTGSTGSASGGCFIATAAYGSSLHPHVQVLRLFRDEIMMRTALGRKFVMTYYRVSPYAAEWIQKRGWAKWVVRLMLGPVVLWAWLTVNTPGWIQLFIYGSALLFIISSIRRRWLWRRDIKDA